ncbi:EamA family transporter, partial [Xanthomonas oryzae pv. oryzae]
MAHAHDRPAQGATANPFLRAALGHHRDPGQTDHAAGIAAGVVAHVDRGGGASLVATRVVLGYCGIGALVALHWLTFYDAIKLANASVAATCIALAPVFTAVIEPWVTKRPFRPRELLFGLAVL